MIWDPWQPSDAHYQHLQIVAHMTEPLLYTGRGLHLDGILAAAAYRDLDPRTRSRMPPISQPWAIDVAIPLGQWRVPVGDDFNGDERLLWRRPGRRGRDSRTRALWGWQATAELVTWEVYNVMAVRKRQPLAEMLRYTDARTLQISGGPLKAYDLAYPTVMAREIRWYAHGDLAEVTRLLTTHISGIGKKTNQGNGAVGRWQIDAADGEFQIVTANGQLLRRMPMNTGVSGVRREGAIRPPYHHLSRVVDAVEPEAWSC